MSPMVSLAQEFWKQKKLCELTRDEWEALCDGCAKCCLHRLEDEDTREIQFTNVACRLLDQESGRCTRYQERSILVPDCITMTLKDLDDPYWLPSTCAYRLLAEGKDLPQWHPLISKDKNSAIAAGITIKGRAVTAKDAKDLEKYIVKWPE